MLLFVKMIGEAKAHTPKIKRMLKMFEPMTLPMAMSPLPASADMKLTVSSGIEVPTATIVRPTINSGIRSFCATATEPSVSSIAPTMISTNDIISNP